MALDDTTFEMMMKYLDGLLSEEEAAEFQELLESSEEVREEFRKYRELEDALGEIRRTAGNMDEEQFIAALHEKMRAEKAIPGPRDAESRSQSWISGLQRWWGITAGFAAGAVAAWLFVVLYPGLSVNRTPTGQGTQVAVRTASGSHVNSGTHGTGSVKDDRKNVPSATNPAPPSGDRDNHDVRLVAAEEELKAYDLEYVTSEYQCTESSVTDDDGYRILVMFVDYDSDPAQAI